MVIVELQFPTGRYHATQWGRNVNEGEAEWPPSPYRLARALVDVWKRRRPAWVQERVEPILRAISSRPLFSLPHAAASHTRSFLSSNKPNPAKKQLVFDPFVLFDQGARVLMGFDCDLTDESRNDFEALLDEFNYLGRSESWVRAGLTDGIADESWNCTPVSSNLSVEMSDTVRVACLLPEDLYDSSPLRQELPEWLNGICFTTKRLLEEGWSDPPALMWTEYVRPPMEEEFSPSAIPKEFKSKFRFAKYALSSKVLPRIQETVSFAERVRVYLMGIHKRIQSDDPSRVSPLFSGKGPDGRPLKGHKHAFFLPLDEDGDGRIDHLLVSAGETFGSSELSALDELMSIWQPNSRPGIDLVLVSLSAAPAGAEAEKWVSATPFVTSRHYRKGRGTYEEWLSGEIARECDFHGLPSPVAVEWIPETIHTRHPIRWMEFMRSRKGGSPLRGHGCILTFERPLSGHFALGSGCHFGLGLFLPYTKRQKT